MPRSMLTLTTVTVALVVAVCHRHTRPAPRPCPYDCLPCQPPQTSQVALRSATEPVTERTAVYICDTLGELPALYGLSGLAFVGGSFVPLGGHNLLEAARADGGCVVLHGPHVEAIAEAAHALASADPPAARCVRDASELEAELSRFLSDETLRKRSRDASMRAGRALEAGVLDSIWSELQGPLRFPPPS